MMTPISESTPASDERNATLASPPVDSEASAHTAAVKNPYLLLGRGESEYRAGRPKRALGPLLEAATGLAAAGEHRSLLDSLLLAGRAARDIGRPSDAAKLFERALALARRLSDRGAEVEALNLQAGLLVVQGDDKGAFELLEAGLASAREADLHERQADLLTNIGQIATRRGDHERAVGALQEALEIHGRNGGGSRSEAAALTNLGHLYREIGDLQRAQEHYTRSRELGRALNDQMIEVVALNNLGNVLGQQGEWHLARQLFHEALALARSLGYLQYQIDNLDGLGEAHSALGEAARAVKAHLEALKLARGLADTDGQLQALIKVGRNMLELERPGEAIAYLSEALHRATELGRRADLVLVHEALARAYEAAGDALSALDHLRMLRALETEDLKAKCEHLAGLLAYRW